MITYAKGHFETDPEVIKTMFAKSRSENKEEIKEFQNWFVPQIQQLINSIISNTFSTYKQSYEEDMFSEGMVSALSVASKFDPEKGNIPIFFKDYIKHGISNYIKEYVHSMSPNLSIKVRKIRDAKEALMAKGIESPSTMDIATETGLRPSVVAKALAAIEALKHVSLEDNSMHDIACSDEYGSPEKVFAQKEDFEEFQAVVDRLSDSEKKVVCHRFGAFGYEKLTNAEIFQRTGISTDRINNILANAIKKIRMDSRFKSHYFSKPCNVSSDLDFEPMVMVPKEAAKQMMEDINIYGDELEF